MKILNASDAKREFGEMLINAQHGPVGINRNGKAVIGKMRKRVAG